MRNNKQIIENELAKHGLTLGIYHDKINELRPRPLKRVIEMLDYGSNDVRVTIKGVRYVVEIAHVDSEVDVMIMPYATYRDRYGRTWNEIGA